MGQRQWMIISQGRGGEVQMWGRGNRDDCSGNGIKTCILRGRENC